MPAPKKPSTTFVPKEKVESPEGRIKHALEANGYHSSPYDITYLLLDMVEEGDIPNETECREVIDFILTNREAVSRVLNDVKPCIFDSNTGNPLQPYASALHIKLSGYSECFDPDEDRVEAETEAACRKILAILAAVANMPVEKPVTLASASQKTSLPPSPKPHGKKCSK